MYLLRSILKWIISENCHTQSIKYINHSFFLTFEFTITDKEKLKLRKFEIVDSHEMCLWSPKTNLLKWSKFHQNYYFINPTSFSIILVTRFEKEKYKKV